MALGHTKLEALKPKDKPYKVSDAEGLFVDVLPSGRMTWRYQYYLHGKREKVTIGRYPDIGLAKARELRAEAAALVAVGQSPAKAKQVDKTERKIHAQRAGDFRKLAERWIEDDVKHKSENWLYSVRNWLKLDIYPAIGHLDPRELAPEHVEKAVASAVRRGSPTSANKVLMICKQIFEYAVDKRELQHNPAMRLKPVRTPDTQSHRALSAKEIGPFLHALEAISTRRINVLAIRMMMLTLIRKDELRLAKWSEFDLGAGVWEIPAHRMKMRRTHRVYLSRQVLEILAELKALGHRSEFLFPSNSTLSKPIGHTTINSVIDRLEIEGARFVPHGFRATASSILNELNFRSDVIERQLAHRDGNKVRAVYNQAEYADERRAMLQRWADYIDSLAAGANVTPINARRAA